MDRVRDGTDNRGEKHPDAKITAALVTEIRRRYAAGESQRALGEEFGLPGPLVSNAVTGKTWGWLPGAVPADLKRHGLQGESHPSAKLTRDIVRECRARYVMGESTRALAAEFGVKQPSMQKAIAGKTWRDA
jgi:hypothetical protein